MSRLQDENIINEKLKLRMILSRAVCSTVNEMGLTQIEAAAHLGISQPRVSALFNGQSKVFRIDSLINMVLKLGLNLSIIVDDKKDNYESVVDNITPEVILDQMYDSISLNDTVAFMDNVQLFWRMDWPLCSINDPNEKDKLKYALKACFVERMVELWNAPPKLQQSSAPDWCNNVAAAEKHFSVIASDYKDFYKGDLISPIFSKRNIFAPRDFMFFV